MWTPAARAQLARDACRYATCLTDAEWGLVAPFLLTGYAGSAYVGERVASATPVVVTVVRAPEGQKGFAVQPRRWVIERSFAWIERCRRLARDHEATPNSPNSALAFFALAAAMVLVGRLARVL